MGKIIICYSTAGIGHKKAALAIKEAFDRNKRAALLIDMLDHTNGLFKKSYNGTYLFLVRHLPTIWGMFYYLLDWKPFYFLVRPVRRFVNCINSRKFVAFLLREKPDTVIVTHFLPLEIIAHLKKKKMLEARLISVITDYKSHIFWLSQDVDVYVAASDYTKEDLIRRGILPERIRVFGIPCAKSFSAKRDREATSLKLGLAPRKRTVFVLGGGFGVGPIKGIVRELSESEDDFQGIVVCGYNETLYNEVVKITGSSRHLFKIYGFVDNVDELMSSSDILVSKPGGITVTEALSAGLPMIAVSPIPGQEMRNYKFLEVHNAAVKIGRIGELKNIIHELFNSDRLPILRKNVENIRRVDSAERIMDEACK